MALDKPGWWWGSWITFNSPNKKNWVGDNEKPKEKPRNSSYWDFWITIWEVDKVLDKNKQKK